MWGHQVGRIRWVGLAVAFVLTAVGPTMQGTSGAATTTGLRVSAAKITLNGLPFVPRGFTMIGALAGPLCTNSDTAAAQDHFSAAELATLAGTWHANTVRFQVSQNALSSDDPALVTQYLATVAQAVGFARAAGLVVILSMQDQPLSCGPGHDFPSVETQHAWDALAPVYSGAPDVMYELFNEPHDVNTVNPHPLLPLSAASWAEWLNGGSSPDPNFPSTAVGHQQLLQHVRSLGVHNVILADGLNQAGVLPGQNQHAPLLRDTMKPANLAYSVHPYYYEAGLDDWEFRFGALAASVPVVATEWNYWVSDCGTTKETMAPGFLTYLSDRGIGVLGMGADLKVGSTLMADWTYAPSLCGAGPGGPGAAFRNYLAATQTPRPTTLTLQATPSVVGAPIPVTGTLLINGAAPSIGMVLSVTRKVGTVTTKLPSLVTGAGGSFAFDGGAATAPGKVKLTVKYAGNGVTRAASATVTVLVTG